ncbi:uncharacterized protein LOC142817599 [Rhipicephalus microplus]|uniref:uncharacterized protein LOC142817599 n=1 Tax=Rhipicephalus microplus TaxID=6941 RepID=UPI003F6D1629
MNETTVFPEDGLCDYIMLEVLPIKLGGPYPKRVEHFLDVASKHRRTEYGMGFDSELEARCLRKIIISLLVDKQNPNRPIYTFVASAWKALSGAQEVSAKDATNNFKKVLMPDLFISIGHYAFHDINMLEKCRLLPATYLQPPQLDSNEQYKYTFGLESATKHVTDIDKLRDKGVEAPSLSVSVGLYGRWHYVDSKAGTKLEDHRPGSQCRPVVTKTQKTGIYEVCVMNKRECLVNFVVCMC